MRQGLINDTEKVIHNELVWSYDEHTKFLSPHDGYAIILEEVEEAAEELEKVEAELKCIWINIKNNQLADTRSLHQYAKLLACEAVQVAAMAKKFEESTKEWRG